MKLKSVKLVYFVLTLLTVASCTTQTINTKGRITDALSKSKICLIAGLPKKDVKYTVIRKIKFGKGSYGKVNDSLYQLIDQAKVLGADAIINYAGSQRFGFWPWRITRPVLRGVAVTWNSNESVKCEDVGGLLR